MSTDRLKTHGSKLTLRPRLVLAVALLAVFAFLPGLGAYRMLDPTDSFFIETAREMIECNHFVTPLFNYADWLDKPALPFLLIVGCFKLFGVSAWAARLPSALAAVALVVYTYVTAVKFLGQRAALIAAVILSGAPLFSIVGHVALSDEPLAMFLGIALLSYARAMILSDKRQALMGSASLALAVLCKGPIGLILCAGIIAGYILLASPTVLHAWNGLKRLQIWQGALILLVFCLPYYILAHITTDGAFTRDFFLRQNLGRFAGTVNHQEPIYWYLPIFLGGFFPWTAMMLASGPWLKALWQKRHRGNHRQSFLLFAVVWLSFVLALFTAIPTKLPTYIVPMAPAFAIIAGAYLHYIIRLGKTSTLWTIFVFLVISLIASPFIFKAIAGQAAQANFSLFFALALMAVMLIFYGGMLWRRRIRLAAVSLVATVYLAVALLVPIMFVEFYRKHQTPLDTLIGIANQKNANFAILFSTEPSAQFLFRHKIESLNSLSEIESFAKTQATPHLLLATGNCFDFKELHCQDHIVAQAGKWYLLSLDQYLQENTKVLKEPRRQGAEP